MSEAELVATLVRGWNQEPRALVSGTDRSGVSAALWAQEMDVVQEVGSDPLVGHHLIAFQLNTFRAETFYDGRLAFAGVHGGGSFNIVRAGLRPRAAIFGAYRCLQLYLPAALVSETAADAGIDPATVELIDPMASFDHPMKHLAEGVLSEMHAGHPPSRLRIDALGLDLAVLLLRRHSNLAGSKRFRAKAASGGLTPAVLRRVLEYIENFHDQDVTLAELAAVASLSSNHFCTAFRQSMGEPPHRYLMRRRIERAREMLADPRLPITEVALACGFASSAHFATAFRKQLGTTPSAFRRELVL